MKKFVLFPLFFLCITYSMYAQSNLQPIAEVKLSGRAPITLGQLKIRIAGLEQGLGRKMTIDERKQTLDMLISEYLIVQAAEKEGLKITDSQVNNYFNEIVSNQLGRNVTEAEFAKMVKERDGITLDEYIKQQNGMTLAEFKMFLKTQMTVQTYVLQKKQKDLQTIPPPSDSEIRSFYEVNKQSFVQPDTVKLFFVAAPKEKSAAAAEKKINELHKKLSANPKSTADILAKSHESNSGYQAFEIFVSKTELSAQQLGIPMEKLLKIFDMKAGSIASVESTPINYRYFMVQEKKEACILGLSDVVQPGSNVTVYEYIKNMATVQRQEAAVQQATAAIVESLRKNEHFVIFKKGAELEKLLSW